MKTVILGSGIALTLAPISGSEIIASQADILDPEVPKFYIEDQKRWVDNPHSPDYALEQRRVAERRASAALRCIVRSGCKVKNGLPSDDRWLRRLQRWEDELLDEFVLHDPEDLACLYIMREAIHDGDDVDVIIRGCCLTEEVVEQYMAMIGVTRHGALIHQVGLKHGVQTGIGHRILGIGSSVLVHPIEEYSACTHSGLDWWHWRSGQYSIDFMTETIAYYRIDRLTENHSKDAEASESERRARQARRKP